MLLVTLGYSPYTTCVLHYSHYVCLHYSHYVHYSHHSTCVPSPIYMCASLFPSFYMCVFTIPIMFTTPIILHVCLYYSHYVHYSHHSTCVSSLFPLCTLLPSFYMCVFTIPIMYTTPIILHVCFTIPIMYTTPIILHVCFTIPFMIYRCFGCPCHAICMLVLLLWFVFNLHIFRSLPLLVKSFDP